MGVNKENYHRIKKELGERVTLVAVSKTKPVSDIEALYELGHRDFGENYVQELVEKQALLPPDIRWHFIGHLQSNKVRYIAPFVHLIHGVDSVKLLKEINKQAEKNQRMIDCLLQVHIAMEETKFGLSEEELKDLFSNRLAELRQFRSLSIRGLMGMASFTEEEQKLRQEFHSLKVIFESLREQGFSEMDILSMGMSSDYRIAVEEGSSLIRVGSLLFGARDKKTETG